MNRKPKKTPKDERREAILFCRKFHTLCIQQKLYLHNEYTRIDYARIMGTNHVYMNRKLKLGSGFNVKDFIRAIRMTLAYQLLKSTNLDMPTVMSHCGYIDRSSFYRAFHARFHCSPTTLRNRFFANA